MLIGITGKSCAGKDFVCQILKQQGYRELNLDAIGHLALQHKQQAVVRAFPELENEQKNIDRKKLANLVFRKRAALNKLENLLHPYMKELVSHELQRLGHTSNIVLGEHTMPSLSSHCNLILNAAILEKLGLLPICNLVLWVEAPLILRAWRAWKREKTTLYRFLRRNWSQRNLCKPLTAAKVHRIVNHKIQKKAALLDIIRQLKQVPSILLEDMPL